MNETVELNLVRIIDGLAVPRRRRPPRSRPPMPHDPSPLALAAQRKARTRRSSAPHGAAARPHDARRDDHLPSRRAPRRRLTPMALQATRATRRDRAPTRPSAARRPARQTPTCPRGIASPAQHDAARREPPPAHQIAELKTELAIAYGQRRAANWFRDSHDTIATATACQRRDDSTAAAASSRPQTQERTEPPSRLATTGDSS